MAAVRCAFCNQPLPASALAGDGVPVRCRTCGRATSATLFPALLRDGAPRPPTLPFDAPQEGEAACFYNPSRRATASCQHCGVLISELWAAQWGQETVCLKCLDHLREQTKDTRFNSKRTLWDNVVLALSLAPIVTLPLLIFYWMVIITAPTALILGLWHWNSPRSLVPRGRLRLLTGTVIAFLQIAAMVGLVLTLWFGWWKKL
jgi:phage FluMu protein Com